MSRIHRLDRIVADQIAAGEVVQRPASVVKELIENSLDAKARQISVHLLRGGQSLIEIQDDGQGIEPDDMALALERHATSKITVLSDLDHSPWLGFRGEALAAISAVSRLTLKSRLPTEPVGRLIRADGGHIRDQDLVAMAPGTVIAVSDLFYNTPARLKSQRSPAAEAGWIQHLVEHLAVGRPDVAFRVDSEERTLLKTPGRGDSHEALYQIYGRELGEALLPVDYTGMTGISIRGWIAPAHLHRGSRHAQSLYVNGRWVVNWILRQAVEEAYRPQVPDRRFPSYWLWIDIPGDAVDPNAHPTKDEVRIDKERQVAALLFRAVHDSLVQKSTAPELALDANIAHESSGEYDQAQWSLVPAESSPADGGILHQEFLELVPLAQWQAKYIIAQGPLGLYLIDQHAAHERLYFEELQRGKGQALVMQPLLVPYALTLTPLEWQALERYRPTFEDAGFEITGSGGTTVMVRSVPQGLRDLPDDPAVFRVILESLLSGTVQHDHPITWIEEPLFAMAACKAAIKAYRPMSHPEMVALIRNMARLVDPRGCPHGRPTLIRLSIEEVDRRFGRKG